MKNVNQRRKYSHIKWMGNKETRFAIGTALHTATDQFKEHLLGAETLKTGGEIDFIRMDRDEIRSRVIDRNRRKLDKLAKNVEVERLVTKLLGGISTLKSAEEPKHPDG